MGNIIEAVAALSAAVGVVLIGIQVALLRKQFQTQFEDSLSSEYRSLIKDIPSSALLGEKISLDDQAKEMVFNYIDLTNSQVFLRMNGRISKRTWSYWCEGIQFNLSLPVFKEVWVDIKNSNNDIYTELRMLELGFDTDPRSWKRLRKL